ncbi:MAG: CDP-diacylglycerol--glycerol-3-phosphate 3-phosphatidyltransferase, partial [Apilactobacillus kunkeei]|nr:CDP-diacylglycerol--glycerol-3-phosphate 3-phosphatidyltransferase [Apilactobacillus kunkeei]
ILLLLNDFLFIPFTTIGFGTLLLYICLFFTVYSGVEYFWKSRFIFADSFK